MFKQMDRTKLKKYGFIGAVVLILAAIALIVIVAMQPDKPANTDAAETTESQEPIVRYVTKDKIVYVDKIVTVEVEKEITTDIIEEGLKDMGVLVTEEYWFKEVTTIDSSKTMAWVVTVDSKVIMSYEGEIFAGIDFNEIKVEKDDARGIIYVKLPDAYIMTCSLDLDSFELYEEKVSKWNMLSMKDYNGSLQELESRAQERALERGILDKAQENAEVLIKNFIEGMIDTEKYSVEFVRN